MKNKPEYDLLSYLVLKNQFITDKVFKEIYNYKNYFSLEGQKLVELLKDNRKNKEVIDIEIFLNLPEDYTRKVLDNGDMDIGTEFATKSYKELLTELEKNHAKDIAQNIINSNNVSEIAEGIDKLKTVFTKTKQINKINLKEASLKFFKNIDNLDMQNSVKAKNWYRFNKVVKLYKGDVTVIAGRPGCLPAGTEVLTKKGWLDISKWTNEEILEINYKTNTNQIDITGQFAKPLMYHKYNTTEFYRMKNKVGTMDLVSSVEHRHPHISEKGFCREFTTRELYNSWINKEGNPHIINIPETFEWFGSGINYSDEYIRLKVAVFADGSFLKSKGSKRCYINIKKDRKKLRLEDLLEKNNLDYRVKEHADEYKRYSFLMDNRDKVFKYDWFLKTNKHQREIIMDELKYWDSYICGGNRLFTFSTVNKETAETIQLIATSLGYRATLRIEKRENKYKNDIIYNLNFSKGTKYGCRTLKKSTVNSFEKVEAGKYMYCFTTNTGFFLIRQNNKIYVTGNSGKTTFALSLALEFAKNGSKGLFFSLEMGEEQIINRMMSQLSLVPINKFQDSFEAKNLSKEEHGRITNAVEEMQRLADNLQIISGNFSSDDILEIAENDKPEFIIIDYMQLLRATEGRGRVEEITYLSMELKRIAMKLQIPIIELCQLSRAVEQRGDKKPILSDLRESGQIEQDASVVIGIYREAYYNEEADPEGMDCIVLKNRNGNTGTMPFKFLGAVQKVYEGV
jgi:replicative DNA helicase